MGAGGAGGRRADAHLGADGRLVRADRRRDGGRLGVEGIAREYRALTLQDPSPVLAVLLTVALSIPPLVAAAYATAGAPAGGRRARSVDAAAWAGAIGLSALLIWALVRRALDAERGGVPGWAWLGIIGVLWGLGLARDLRPAVVRTRTRLRVEGRPNRPGAAFVALRVFLDELVPGREAGRAEAAESERGRLAADLHADVLPSLRRALAEAEGGGTVERLAADLRTAVDEVEALLLARRSIVLEEMGLLSGIEWLAERTEDRSDVRVQILVDTDGARSRRRRRPAAARRGAGRIPRRAARPRQRRAPRARRLGRRQGRGHAGPRPGAGRGRRGRAADRRGGVPRGAAGAGSRTCGPRRRRPARRWRSAAAPATGERRSATAGTPSRVASTRTRTPNGRCGSSRLRAPCRPQPPLRDPTDGRARPISPSVDGVVRALADPARRIRRTGSQSWPASSTIRLAHRDDERGQGLAEYALILALIAIVSIVALIFLGGAISDIISSVGASM